MQSLVKHCLIGVFEKINVVLNALLVALRLVQAELQVLQTHLKLFLCLQVKIQTDRYLLGLNTPQVASRMNSVQSDPAPCQSVALCAQEKHDTHSVLILAKKPQLVIPSALLGFQLQDFGLKGLLSGNSLVFYLVDLDKVNY